MKSHFNKNTNRGFAMMLAILFFLAILLTVVLGIANPILKQVKIGNDLFRSKQSFYLAQAGLDDAAYRIKTNKLVNSGDTLTINGSTATLALTDNYNAKVLISEGRVDNHVRRVKAEVVLGIGTSFNYGVQTGNGGFILANNSGVNGNVYSNGNIVGSNAAFITGSAVASNSAAPTADQSNEDPTPLPTCLSSTCINFGQNSATQDLAQSFVPSTSGAANKVVLYIRKTGLPNNATVRIVTNSGSSPSATILASGALSGATVTTSFGWLEVLLSTQPQLVAGTTYWIVIDTGTQSLTDYYTIGANTAYMSGQAKIGQLGSSWSDTSPAGLDANFKLYLGGVNGSITNVLIGTGGIGDARAHTVTNSTVSGNLYCQTGSGNNKSCDTSQADPVPQGFPVSEANIQEWKTDAEEGGIISGNYVVTGNVSLGPKKIVGNLTVNGTLTMTGVLWVTGNLTGANGSRVQLSSTYGSHSGVLVTDGYIDISNNMQFSGVPSQPDTYILLLTTSACPNASPCAPNSAAIYLGNNAGAVLMNAQNGKLFLKNGSSVSEAVAYQIELDPNAVVTYSSGLASQVFSSGPSGGWNIISWKEIQ
ncbi:hypothetical protein KW782_02465 [Candidatus Parcubacteria bacterium]|nr:hypothetical protein [Candidatus Parcubacteria bacterium]